MTDVADTEGQKMLQEASRTLKRSVDYLLDRWLAELRNAYPADMRRRLSTRKIMGNARAVLEDIALFLEKDELIRPTQRESKIYREASHFGELRQVHGFTLADLIEDFAKLRQLVMRVLTEELRTRDVDSYMLAARINLVMDRALKAMILAFDGAEKDDLAELATIDRMTGLCDHAHFWIRLQEEVQRAKRYHHPFSLLMIDIDDFKQYNDAHGHLQGDKLLKDIALILRANRRASDVVARYGGEEFTIILPETTSLGARAAAERIREAVAAHPFGDSAEKLRPVTVSIGCAACDGNMLAAAALVQVADEAMYEAKRLGKNRVCVYSYKGGQRISVP